MIEDPREHDSPSIKLTRPRPRFSLRTVFILMTLLCLGLGWWKIRERRISAMLAAHNDVVAALEKSIANPPAGTHRFGSGNNSTGSFMSYVGGHRPSQIYEVGDRTICLRVEPQLANQPLEKILHTLLAPYEQDLTAAGLRRNFTTSGLTQDRAESRVVYTLPEHGITVTLDLDVDKSTQQLPATVRIFLVHHENASLW